MNYTLAAARPALRIALRELCAVTRNYTNLLARTNEPRYYHIKGNLQHLKNTVIIRNREYNSTL